MASAKGGGSRGGGASNGGRVGSAGAGSKGKKITQNTTIDDREVTLVYKTRNGRDAVDYGRVMKGVFEPGSFDWKKRWQPGFDARSRSVVGLRVEQLIESSTGTSLGLIIRA